MPGPGSIRIATRNSALAMWQAQFVANQLKGLYPDIEIELVAMTTAGDRKLDRTLVRAGGKGLFVKELEEGLLAGRADVAVHSMKDVPMTFPAGLHLPVILAREDARDAFISNGFGSLDELPSGARVGTSSLRRQCQLRASYPELRIVDVRGNVDTRLAKLDAGDFDALMLAAAGLKRLGWGDRITAFLSVEQSLPAIGQGAIGIECRQDDFRVRALIAPLAHAPTRTRVLAERATNARLHGGCETPLAAFAELEGETLWLRAFIGYPDGSRILRSQVRGVASAAEGLGRWVAEDLLAQGAGRILAALGIEVAGR